MKKLFTIICITLAIITNAQNYFRVNVLDFETNEALIGATLLLKGTNNGVSTDVDGLATLKNIPNGDQTIVITFIGYEKKELKLAFPLQGEYKLGMEKAYTVLLKVSDVEIIEIIIECTRGNRTVANLPTRTEVLTEEIDAMVYKLYNLTDAEIQIIEES